MTCRPIPAFDEAQLRPDEGTSGFIIDSYGLGMVERTFCGTSVLTPGIA